MDPKVFLSVLAKLFFFFLIISHLAVLKGSEEPSEPERKVTQRILRLEEPEGDQVLPLWVRNETTSDHPTHTLLP